MAFPEKSSTELSTIAKAFYRHLSDILVEGLKGVTLSKKELVKRYKFLNPELSEKLYKDGKHFMIVGSHFANWEWGVLAGGLQVSHRCNGLYKPLSNHLIDNYFKKGRAKMGMHLASIKETRAVFSKITSSNTPECFILLADQSPSNLERAIWLEFLGIETACLHGPEYYAKKYDLTIFYVDVQRIKRGYYTVKYIPISENSKYSEEGIITSSYMSTLEQIVKLKPEHWLWSHRRWKHKRQQQ